MKKTSIAILAIAGLLMTPTVATATELSCTDAPAWVEVIEHEAEGTETIVVDNPDYVAPTYVPGYTQHIPAAYTPPVGSPTITVDNPDYVAATPETSEIVHHEAVTATQWKYVKNGGHGEVWLDNNTEHKVKINGHWYQRTSNTKTVTITAAWDETVIVPGTPAVGEPTITIDNPEYVAPTYTPAHDVWVAPVYTQAIGTKTIEIANPDYVAPWAENIEHAAVVCETPAEEPTEEEPTTEEPVVKTPVAPTTTIAPKIPTPRVEAPTMQQPVAPQAIETAASGELAETGSDGAMLALGAGGLGLLALGAGSVLAARRTAKH